MTSAHIIFDDPVPWYFYAILLLFTGIIVYSGYLAVDGILALFGLRPLRKVARQASVSTTAISAIIWFKALSRIGFLVFVTYGTWFILSANFRCFRVLDVADRSIHLSYNLHTLDSDVPMTDIRSMAFEHLRSRDPKRPYIRLEITTVDGRVFHSIQTRDQAVIKDCQYVIDTFYKRAA